MAKGRRSKRIVGKRDKGTIDIDYGWIRQRKLMSMMSNYYVSAGWHEGNQHPDAQMTTAELAMIHEYGAPSKGIPSRPTLGPVHNTNRDKYVKAAKRIWQQVLDGRGNAKASIAIGLERLGQIIVNDLKRYMTKGDGYVPLKPATVAAKGSSRPLIDTGHLRNSIEAKVQTK